MRGHSLVVSDIIWASDNILHFALNLYNLKFSLVDKKRRFHATA